jgi:2-oxoisovalerate dehydrogenase E2 component (dihydrolipoyl transacylase)
MTTKDFLLPDLGEGLEEAEVVTWRVAEGDRVELNQPLVEVNTAKALVEIPSPFAGVVARLHAGEGDVVQVGAPLVTFELSPAGAEGAEQAEAAEAAAAGVQAAQETSEERVAGTAETAAEEARPKRRAVLVGYGVAEEEDDAGGAAAAPARRDGGPTRATPPVRRLARDLGIDLTAVAGTGPGGRVTREDVERAAAPGVEAKRAPGPGGELERISVRGTRRLVAERMARSWREIPHVTTFLTVDCLYLDMLRKELTEEAGERISPLPIVVRALVETCRDHPLLNASFDAEAGEIRAYRDCHVGIATDTERGLVVAVVRDAGSRGIREIAAEIARLSEGARAGRLGPQELTGSTITVTNVGSFGAESGTPIINHPEGAILATGVIGPRALVVEGEVAVRPAMTLSLSFDHRLLDGAQAGWALRDVGRLLESPFRLGALPR